MQASLQCPTVQLDPKASYIAKTLNFSPPHTQFQPLLTFFAIYSFN